MYQRLKERALHQARREIVQKPRQERVVFLAGRRRTESARRANIPELNRTGSIVWVSPMVNWTKTDLYTYRDWAGDVPRNRVSDLIHMSGECLCGAFAHKDELAEIEMFFPEVAEEIRELEVAVRAAGHPEKKCKWGWGATEKLTPEELKSGPLCSSCEYRMEGVLDELESPAV
jgi:3'-phosphoadenosine 5'-phosphosulfate sulfotransferase (PAPS reductase)/FAD synthetase